MCLVSFVVCAGPAAVVKPLCLFCRAEVDSRASARAALSSGSKGSLGRYSQVRYAAKDSGPVHMDTACVCGGTLPSGGYLLLRALVFLPWGRGMATLRIEHTDGPLSACIVNNSL